MSTLSAKEKGTCASDLIKQAPPGEFKEVLSDVRTLLQDDSVLKEQCLSAIKEHNEKMFTPCKVSKDSASLVTAHGFDGSHYIDNKNKLKFVFDHVKRESVSDEKITLSDTHRQYFDSINTDLEAYVKDHYKNGNYAVYFSGPDDSLQIIICIESHAFSPNNFWNGIYLSEYTVDMRSKKLKGKISAQIHYFEDGNVQLISNKDVDQDLKDLELKNLGPLVMGTVKKQETMYQEALVEDINNMMETTFKALRRALPITRTKIEWEKIFAYGLGQELGK